MGFWNLVAFSDEKRFCLTSDSPQRVWRRKNERFHRDCIANTRKHGGGGIMVWRVITRNGPGDLRLCEENVDRFYYRRILHENVAPTMKRMFTRPDLAIFHQQDNARPHTAKICQEAIEELNLKILPWPANSPDMSPIENLWSYLANKLKGKEFRNKNELFAAVSEEWDRIPMDLIHKLYDSMPDRINALLKAGGQHTRY